MYDTHGTISERCFFSIQQHIIPRQGILETLRVRNLGNNRTQRLRQNYSFEMHKQDTKTQRW